jgi:ribosome-interacting GTPase 1
VPALTRIGGVLVQLVEIPGLIEGATEDRGGGRALLGVLRFADAIVYCARPSADPEELRAVMHEVELAEIDLPHVIAATRSDESAPEALEQLRAAFPGERILPVSILDDASLEAFREVVWGLTGLIRVYLRTNGATEPEPAALPPGSTVADVAESIHHDLAASLVGARIWGPSARFDGQKVGRDQPVQDGDIVEILKPM